MEAVAACRKVTNRTRLDTLDDPLGSGSIVRNDERFQRNSKIRRPSVSRAQELFDRFLTTDNLTSGDIFIDCIVSEDEVNAFWLMERPCSVKLWTSGRIWSDEVGVVT